MAERRRPLENDDGQRALFGGEEFAPERPWDRPAGSPASEARVEHPRAIDAQLRVEPPTRDVELGVADLADSTEGGAAPVEADRRNPRTFERGARTPTEVPAHDELVAADELTALERATHAADEARSPRAPLAGPTLDDVMSRVWEGLVTGMPAACPICHGEVVPSVRGPLHARCRSCGTTID